MAESAYRGTKAVEAKLFGFGAQGEYTGKFADTVRGTLSLDRVEAYFADLLQLAGKLWQQNQTPVIALELVSSEGTLRFFAPEGPVLRWSSKDLELPEADSPTEAAGVFIEQFGETRQPGDPHRSPQWESPLPEIRIPRPTEQEAKDEREADAATARNNRYFERAMVRDPAQSYARASPTVIASIRPRLFWSVFMVVAVMFLVLPIYFIAGEPDGLSDKGAGGVIALTLIIAGIIYCVWCAWRFATRCAILVDRGVGVLFAVEGKQVKTAVRLDEVDQIAARGTELRERFMHSAINSEVVAVDGTEIWIVLKQELALRVFQLKGQHEVLVTKSNEALGLRSTKDWSDDRVTLTAEMWSKMWFVEVE